MSTSFKMKCIADIINNISLPATNCFVINNDNMRICYKIGDCNKYKYICLKSREEVAKFLRDKGKIEFFSIKNDVVKLFVKKVITIEKNNMPVQHIKMVELNWHEIEFTHSELLHYAAEHEYKLKCTLMGLAKAKIIHFKTEIFRAA